MLAVVANKTSAIIQFRLTQFLCCISPEERAAVEVKILNKGLELRLNLRGGVGAALSIYATTAA